MEFMDLLLKEIAEGRKEADLKALVKDMLGADPAQVLNNATEKINPMLSGNPLEIAAVLFVMNNTVKGFLKIGNETVNALYEMYEKVFSNDFSFESKAIDENLDEEG